MLNQMNKKILAILMHLQMKRDVWLDNVINLRQYILRYTVTNSMSLRNVAKCIYAAGERFYAAGSYIFTVFLKEKKVNYSAVEWG